MQDDGQLNSLKEGVSAVQVDRVIVLWTANTERYSEVAEGLNDTTEAFLSSIDNDESEVAPSSIYAAASILEGVPFINGSPQNTFVPGLIDLAIEKGGHTAYPELFLTECPHREHPTDHIWIYLVIVESGTQLLHCSAQKESTAEAGQMACQSEGVRKGLCTAAHDSEVRLQAERGHVKAMQLHVGNQSS